ncbi:MAG TPA: hypothetical protein V6D17_13950 [Candidatus Obscuribacterales bacterium]
MGSGQESPINYLESGTPPDQATGFEEEFVRAEWRQQYGGDTQNNFQQGGVRKPWESPGNNGGQWRATYGGDTGQTFRQGQPSQQQQSGGQWRATYGGDVNQTFKPGQQTSGGQWRAPYGGDVDQTFRPGQQQPGNGQWRKPWEADSPLVPRPGNGQPGDGSTQPYDPNANGNQPTGPRWDPTRGGTRPIDGGQLPGQPQIAAGSPWSITDENGKTYRGFLGADGKIHARDAEGNLYTLEHGRGSREYVYDKNGKQVGAVKSRGPNAQLAHMVEHSIDINTQGYYGNLVAGAAGGVLGKHSIPWAMDRLAKSVTLDPHREPISFRQVLSGKTPEPMTFRQRLVGYWQDNHNETTWNRTDLNTIKGDLQSHVDSAKASLKANEAKFNYYKSRFSMLEPLTDSSKASEWKQFAQKALDNDDALRTAGKRPLFSAKETELLKQVVTDGKIPAELETVIQNNAARHAVRNTRQAIFQTLSDTKVPIADRKAMIEAALTEHEAAIKANSRAGTLTKAEVDMLKKYTTSADALAATQAKQLEGWARVKDASGRYGASIAKGAGIAAAFMVADHYLDKAINGKDHANGIGSSLNSVLVPTAFLAGEKLGFKKMALLGIGSMAAGHIAGRMLDEALPAGEYPRFSKTFSQSTPESLILAGEFLLPMKSATKGFNIKKAGLMLGTWAAFRVGNYLFSSGPPSEVKEDAFNLLVSDSQVRTAGSMNDAIDKFKSLGKGDESTGIMSFTNWVKEGKGKTKGGRGEAALDFYRQAWLTKSNDQFSSMLEAYRGATILCTAFAESRLSKGTHIPTETQAPTYILEGKNLDLGGKAARDLIIARINIDRAKTEAQNKMGQEVGGKKVTEHEIADLDKVKERIAESEAKIYGKHDMRGVVDELAHWGQGLNATHFAKLEVALRDNIAKNQNGDKRYLAKLYRDLATIYIASAEMKKGGDPRSAQRMLYGDNFQGRQARDVTGQMRGFDGAMDVIRRAQELDPQNTGDVEQLNAMAVKLDKEIQESLKAQGQNPVYDPLQVRRGQ